MFFVTHIYRGDVFEMKVYDYEKDAVKAFKDSIVEITGESIDDEDVDDGIFIKDNNNIQWGSVDNR